jgi:hypothetical protein
VKLVITSKAFKNLKSLGDDAMSDIDSRLLAGEPASSIATYIQDDLGKLRDIKRPSLKKTLERYRETELRDKTLARIAGAQKGQSIKTVNARINALDEMEVMFRQQRSRVDKLLLREDQLPGGILLKDTTKELGLMKDMLFDLGKLQLDTGVLARAQKTMKGTMTTPDGLVHEFQWTEEQEELFRAIADFETGHEAPDAR